LKKRDFSLKDSGRSWGSQGACFTFYASEIDVITRIKIKNQLYGNKIEILLKLKIFKIIAF
jgi:hypothetical protein